MSGRIIDFTVGQCIINLFLIGQLNKKGYLSQISYLLEILQLGASIQSL